MTSRLKLFGDYVYLPNTNSFAGSKTEVCCLEPAGSRTRDGATGPSTGVGTGRGSGGGAAAGAIFRGMGDVLGMVNALGMHTWVL